MHSRSRDFVRRDDVDERADRVRWYRQPVGWLAALILFASVAGCALLVALALRNPDPQLPTAGFQLLKVPAQRADIQREAQP